MKNLVKIKQRAVVESFEGCTLNFQIPKSRIEYVTAYINPESINYCFEFGEVIRICFHQGDYIEVDKSEFEELLKGNQ